MGHSYSSYVAGLTQKYAGRKRPAFFHERLYEIRLPSAERPELFFNQREEHVQLLGSRALQDRRLGAEVMDDVTEVDGIGDNSTAEDEEAEADLLKTIIDELMDGEHGEDKAYSALRARDIQVSAAVCPHIYVSTWHYSTPINPALGTLQEPDFTLETLRARRARIYKTEALDPTTQTFTHHSKRNYKCHVPHYFIVFDENSQCLNHLINKHEFSCCDFDRCQTA